MSFLQSGREWSKPLPGVSINWSHPFAKGLKSLLLFNEGSGAPVDIARDVIGITNGTSDGTRWRASDRGVVGRTLATTDYWTFGSCSFLPTRQGTLLLIMKKNDTTNRGAGHIGIQGNPASARRFGVHVPFSDGTVYWDFGGQTSPNRLSKASLTVSGVNAWAFVAGTRGMAIYQNGQLVASSSTAVTRTADTSNWCVNQANNATGDLCDFHFGAVLDAEWTQEMVAKWTADPFLFISRPNQWLTTGVVPTDPVPFVKLREPLLVEEARIAPVSSRWNPGIANAGMPPNDPISWFKRLPPPPDAEPGPARPSTWWSSGLLDVGPPPPELMQWFVKVPQDYSTPLVLVQPPRPYPEGIFVSPPTNPRDDGVNKPFLARDPRVDARLRRFTELLTDLVNSLIGGGYFQQLQGGKWIVTQPPFNETRDPFIMDDLAAGCVAGMSWYNSVTGKLWYCVDDSLGAAVWVRVN